MNSQAALMLEGKAVHGVTQVLARPVCSVSVRRRVQTPSTHRHIHTSQPKEQDALLRASHSSPVPPAASPDELATSGTAAMSALSGLPLSQILRTYLITSISSSPAMLGASSKVLRQMLESKSSVFNVEKNPVLRAVLWETFYKQFCAGATPAQVQNTCDELRVQGYSGVILEYALEVLKDAEGDEVEDVAKWRHNLLRTVDTLADGDYAGLKWSGMGPAALRLMTKNEQPSPRMEEAMNAVCQAAAAKGVSLLPAAEESWSLDGFNSWTMKVQRAFNRGGRSVVYNTYQAYLKQTPANLSQHLAMARQENFTLGIKLVRGAYLASEVRDLIYPTIEDTHHAYDTITSALIHREYNDLVKPFAGSEAGTWPKTNVMLATHNAATVQTAQTLRKQQAARGEELTTLTFAQLQGMADEVSCSLIANARASAEDANAVKEKVFKCSTWGSMQECLNYLLRRAAENKDAAGRTIETRRAVQAELVRRMKAIFGLA